MKYTAGELRKMNGRKCKLQYCNRPEAEWEIYIVDWKVSFVSNNYKYAWHWLKKDWYEYSWLLYNHYDDDLLCTTKYDSITFLDEPHQNIYYDDNGEIIREWDWVLVSNWKLKRIFLCKIPRCRDKYACVNNDQEDLYTNGTWYVWISNRSACVKYKEPEKKLRELMLTDEEYEEVKNKYK